MYIEFYSNCVEKMDYCSMACEILCAADRLDGNAVLHTFGKEFATVTRYRNDIFELYALLLCGTMGYYFFINKKILLMFAICSTAYSYILLYTKSDIRVM